MRPLRRTCELGIAAVLFCSGIAKLLQLTRDVAVSLPFDLSEGLWAGLAQFECAAALTLVLVPGLRATRIVSFVLFSIFLVSAVAMHFEGRVTCGCFGEASLQPIQAAGLDLAVLLMIIAGGAEHV